MNTSGQTRGFLARRFRSFTKALCHPFLAWAIFLLLVIYNLILVSGVYLYFDMRPGQVQMLGQFHGDLLDSQEVIIEDLEKTLAAARKCQ